MAQVEQVVQAEVLGRLEWKPVPKKASVLLGLDCGSVVVAEVLPSTCGWVQAAQQQMSASVQTSSDAP